MTNTRFTNRQLADIFTTIGDMLEIKGEVIYKILAYRKAADSLNDLGRDVNDIWREGRLTEIPGVGKAIAEKID
jgi:DNA polymerase (family 10)